MQGQQFFKAIVAGNNGVQGVYVFRLHADEQGWDLIDGPWAQAEKPATVSLEQWGDVLRVTTAVRGSAKDYPSETFCKAGVCATFCEQAEPVTGDDYVTYADLTRPLSPPVSASGGRWFEPLALRITKQLRAIRQFIRYLRFIGVLS